MSTQLTEEQFKKALPKHMRSSINPALIAAVNGVLAGDVETREAFRDNILSYTSVIREGKFKITSYLEAVKYVTHKLMGDTNLAAYAKTFPDRYQKLVSAGRKPNEISAYVAAYNKNKLVNLIYEQTLVPAHVLNADIYQKAINKQADLMMNARSEKVQTDAANSLLNHLKPPETKKIELDVGIKEDSVIDSLRQSTMELVAQQKRMVQSGVSSAQQIAHSEIIIEGELDDGS